MFRVRSLGRALVRHPAVGRPAAAVLRHVGAAHIARRVALRSGVAPPPVVEIDLPRHLFHQATLSMRTAEGRDQVAMRGWTSGWTVYESPLPAFFAATVQDGDVVLDVGANTGYYALLAASIGPDVRCYAFEPMGGVADRLDANLRLGPQGSQVIVVRQAVDSAPGDRDLFIPLQHHGLVEASASLARDFRSAHSDVLRVRATTLDTFVRESGLTKVDVVKIDVEGLEDRVLEGAERLMRVHRPVIFLEVLDCDDWHADTAKLDDIRAGADYVSVQLSAREAVCTSAVAIDPNATNQALWPSERLAGLAGAAARIGARVTSQLPSNGARPSAATTPAAQVRSSSAS